MRIKVERKGRVKIRNDEKVKVVKQRPERLKLRKIRMADSKMWDEGDFKLGLQGGEVIREPGQKGEELGLQDLEEMVVLEEILVCEENLAEWEMEMVGEEPEVEMLEVEQRERGKSQREEDAK